MLEKDIKRLEEIAKILEDGCDLDESLKLYEEGCKLAKGCLKELEKAKGKIIMVKKEFNKKDENDG
ncbi:MAG: exodeoxyribonuclease VII small subunit [Clostridia bacterium]|nr:exodeoxyribonuclease VII small subunit [Clostridia bacterium]